MRRTGAGLALTLALVWLLVVASVYVRDVGRGFVKDDFGWIDAGRAALTAPAAPILSTRIGFYRPLVVYSFALDYLAYGSSPRGYGFTNLALYVACVLAVWALGRALELSPPAAMLAAMLWGLNPHGINMALVWLSGRTSLCLTLFAVAAATALMKRRYAWTAIFTMLALASKEEAMLLAPILLAWHWLLVDDAAGRRWAVLALVTPLAVYLLLRTHAGAYTPASAPSYYQFSFAPLSVLRNLFEYTDRAATMTLVAMVIAANAFRARPIVSDRRYRLAAACAIWFAGGYALTVFLPVRSSLYALFPSVGVAMAAAAVVESMAERTSAGHERGLRFGASMMILMLALIPIYRARNGRYVEPARFSERALQTIDSYVTDVEPGSVILLHDVSDPTSNFVGAFGSFASDAVRLHSGRALDVLIDPPPGEQRHKDMSAAEPPPATVAFATDRGHIFRVGPEPKK